MVHVYILQTYKYHSAKLNILNLKKNKKNIMFNIEKYGWPNLLL